MKEVIKIVVFIVLLLFVFTIDTYIKKPKTIDTENINGLYSEKKDSLDVVYIGGSAAFVYYEPLMAFEEYGIASYDYASNTIQCELYKYMIKEILKTQKPEVIVIDARAFQYREKDQVPIDASYRNLLSGMHFSYNKVNLVNSTVNQYLDKPRLTYLFDLTLYHSSNDEINFGESIQMLLGKYESIYKGFYFVPKAYRMQKQEFLTDEIGKVASETDKILDDLINYLKTTKTKALFVVSPYIETKEEKMVFNYVENKVTNAGYNFIDANEYDDIMEINYDTDFYNYNHVNIYGADKYTKFLSDYIKKNYNIKDRRKDKKYSNWYNNLDIWNENKRNIKLEIDKIIEGGNYDSEIYIKQ